MQLVLEITAVLVSAEYLVGKINIILPTKEVHVKL